ncbi:Oidioi.mRNA.OKI2018_I69.chr2.g4862.t1.cds [Oikopleura dioica]|uniref:Sulfotransferase n=1 Tax=Oikopleura dioica TaxID=34765 RepID=A0ABN7T2Y5_OIKDI|nr:Oidioi.mRNA.OKI2018_I69.chr2.g4862.t1.cds [Oikopleura dioica]
MTLYRAGSTFTGELFNRNKDIFYHFEPFTLFEYDWTGKMNKTIEEKRFQLLESIFVDCKLPLFSDWKDYAENSTTVKNVCQTEDTCFWFNSRRFCAPPFCSKTYEDHICRKPCFPGPAKKADLAEKICINETKATAAKIIRVLDVQQFVDFFNRLDGKIEGKIVLLARDPRAMLESRKKLTWPASYWGTHEQQFFDQLEVECAKFAANKKNESKWKEMVKIIRYEDIAMDPIAVSKETYEFLDMEISEDVHEYLKAATEKDDSTKYSKDNEFLKAYSTKRNSKENLQKWRKTAAWDRVQKVQKICEEYMAVFGYKIFRNQEELKNEKINYF